MRGPRPRWWRPLAAAALAGALGGCALPSWVPLVGSSKTNPAALTTVTPSRIAPLPEMRRADLRDGDEVVDRVVCVVNNDAITLYDLDEAEAYHLSETKQTRLDDNARKKLRDDILNRMIESRLQLQQAEREKLVIEDAELNEAVADVMKKVGAKTEADFVTVLKAQGVTLDAAKKRLREQLLVQKIVRRKVALRVTVTEQEIDTYIAANRDKLETGLTFEARHILFLPEAGQGEEGWATAKRRAEDVYAELQAGEDFATLARKFSDDGSGKAGGALGPLKRGELAVEIERAILALAPGQYSAPFRSEVGYHLFLLDKSESLSGDGLRHVRSQVRDILFREKYETRLKDWVGDIRQRAVIDVRL
ncbi:MAG: peptidylprolyl isomerase [Candidatus Rokubacteria bacterium]|nr:peptidylprolyl isomerase [Candidatus Rokubacteria bacterium]